LRDRGGTTHVIQQQHLDVKLTAVIRDAQHVSNVDLSRRLGCLPVE
jgi:hypothetical protein